MTDLPLHKVSETATKITLGWAPVAGAIGYRFQSSGTAPKWSHTWDPSRNQVVFAKGQEPYVVQALGVDAEGTWPAAPAVFGAELAAQRPRHPIPGSPTLVSNVTALRVVLENGGNAEIAAGTYDFGGLVVRPTAPVALRAAPGANVLIKHLCLSPRGHCWVHKAAGASLTLDGSVPDFPCLWPYGTAHSDYDGLEIRNSLSSGVLCGSTDWQFWHCDFHHNGTDGNQDHGIYTSTATNKCVIAACRFYDNWAFNMHLYPNADDLVVTGCTVDGGLIHDQDGGTRGGVIIGSSTADETHGVRVYATVSTNAPASQGFRAYLAPTDCQLYDCVGYGNAHGDFDPGLAQQNCVHADPLYTNRHAHDHRPRPGSPLIGHADPSRHGWLPNTYRDGTPRLTATIGSEAPA